MKPLQLLVLCLLLFSSQVFAQQKAADVDSKKNSSKDDWLTAYNELKPKLNQFLGKVKEEGVKRPEFTEEVKKLDQMMTAFKQQLDKWETSQIEPAKLQEILKQDYQKIKEQFAKVKNVWETQQPREENYQRQDQ